jgi:putative transposase
MKATVAKVLKSTGGAAASTSFAVHLRMPQDRTARRLRSLAKAFAQDDAEAAKTQWRRVADQFRPKLPKLAAFLDAADTDVFAYTTSRRSTRPSCTQ